MSTSATAPTPIATHTYTSQANVTSDFGAGYTFIQNSAGTSFTATGLTAGTEYYFYVFAYATSTCAGSPAYSTVLSGTNYTYTCPAAPTGSATPSSSSAVITWSTTAGYTYNLQWELSGGSFATITGVTSPYTLTGLTGSSTYIIQLSASVNGEAVCNNVYGGQTSFTTECPVTSAGFCTYHSSQPGRNQPAANRHSTGATQVAGTVSGANISYNLTGLPPCTQYYYKTYTANGSGYTYAPGTQTFTTTGGGVPTVTAVSPSSACLGTTPTITITGTNFTPSTTVVINGAAAATNFTYISTTSISVTLPSLSAGSGNVVVTNCNGRSLPAPANAFTVTAPPTLGTPAQGGPSGCAVSVSATASSGAVAYWQTVSGGTCTTCGPNPYTSPQTVTANGTYYFNAYNSTTGCWSGTSSIAVSSLTAPSTETANNLVYCSNVQALP